MLRLKPINQQVVVVVGASSGIGRATALRFAEQGASVVCAARSERGLHSLVAEITRKGGAALAVVVDVADADHVKRLADRAVAEYGRIDTWVHLAATALWATAEQTHPQEYRRLVEVNLLGQIHGALAALPYLRREGRGALVHVSSVEGVVALPYNSAYAASKHGLNGFLDALRLELRGEGAPISVTTVMPAAIDTPLFDSALTRLGVKPRGVAPVYDPEVVARAIVYAAENPVDRLVPGGAGVVTLLARRFAPRLLDAVLLTRVGFESQLTSQPRSSTAPNNLFSPTPDENLKIHGTLGAEAKPTSLLTRIQTSGLARLRERVEAPFLAAAARAVEALWALGNPADARAATAPRPEPREGGAMPKPMKNEMRREMEPRREVDGSRTELLAAAPRR
jgi:NAD(P)-dependent dehydrogenase (short-subunit alcohol dehydrogenase family)